jgi:hypothetical protein
MRPPRLLTAIAVLALGCHSTPLGAKRLDATVTPDAAATPDVSLPPDAALAPDAPALPDVAPEVIPLVVPPGATVVAAGQASPSALALADGNLYWLNLGAYHVEGPKVAWWNGAQVMTCPKSGCPDGPTTLVSGRQLFMSPALYAFATDGQYVYWDDLGPDTLGDGGGTSGGLLRCAVTGCNNTPERIGEAGAWALAVAGGILYAAHYSADVACCPISGCASPPDQLWTGDQTDSNLRGAAVATDATDVYWTTKGTLMRCAQAGCDGTPTVLVPTSKTFWNFGPLALDATNVYFGQGIFSDSSQVYPGQVLACAKAGCGGTPKVLATSTYLQSPLVLASDGFDVYWTELDGSLLPSREYGLVRKCPVAGCTGAPVTVASGVSGPFGVAVDDQYVYWTEAGSDGSANGRIWRAPK